jgi:hypothetical protein
MRESHPVGEQVAAMFAAIKASAPKLQVLRASKIGIPPETAMPQLVELCAPGSALSVVDLRGNKFPLKDEAKTTYEGCKREGLQLLLPGEGTAFRLHT